MNETASLLIIKKITSLLDYYLVFHHLQAIAYKITVYNLSPIILRFESSSELNKNEML